VVNLTGVPVSISELYNTGFFFCAAVPGKTKAFFVGMLQGDQIGRIFAYIGFWRLFSLARLLKMTEVAEIIGILISTVTVVHQFRHKNWLGCILGDFFTNSSGHPGLL
jgi:uncharacterized membrane protein